MLDGAGLVLLPGFVDLHTHLREPGGEESEDDRHRLGRGRARRVTPRCSPCPTPTRWPTPTCSSSTCGAAASRSGWSTCTRSVRSPSGCEGERMAELGTMARSAAGADVLRRRPLRARSADHAPGPGVRLRAGRGDRPARRGPPAHRGRAGARGRGRRPGSGWPAGRPPPRRRSSPGTARWPARPARRCTSATSPSARTVEVLRGGQGGRGAGHRRGHPAPPAAHRRRADRLRPGQQGQPAAAHRGGHQGACGPRWPRA